MEVSVTGDRELLRAIDDLMSKCKQATMDAVNEFALNVQAQAKRNISDWPVVDTGRLRASVKVVTFSDGLARWVGSDVGYAPFVEFGTRPHFPPLEPIREWCRRHGIPETAAYAIALKISRTGQPARPWLFPAYEEERPKFEAIIMAAYRKLKAGE